jgi:ferredoxin-nitrite reductase
MISELDNAPFTTEQKEYLAGFLQGLKEGFLPFVGETASGKITYQPEHSVTGNLAAEPEEDLWFGVPVGDLSKEELIKREENPLDIFEKMAVNAAEKRFPEGGDVFRYKFHGLFYVAPAEEAFMVRIRVPGNCLASYQLRAIADIAKRWGGGFADVTTRGNLQVRQIKPEHTVDVLLALQEAGLSAKGSGGDNVRNITATPTSGLDPQELIDVMPLAKAMQFYISNHRELYGLPRKFNIAFDGGGSVSVVSDTNDLGFVAVTVPPGGSVEPGTYFRLLLGGVTGHEGGLPQEGGVLVRPEECVSVAGAVLRAFIKLGDRTNRKKARLKYVIDDLGAEPFLEEVEAFLAFPLRRVAPDVGQAAHPVIRHGHVGVFKQKQRGLNYIGLQLSVGRVTPDQMRLLADLADKYGTGELRTTVWQNFLLPHVKDADVNAASMAIERNGMGCVANVIRSGIVACTGNKGCRYASTDTKGQAAKLSSYLAEHVALDLPVNIHLTGCPHSCAQHYVGDIGLLGAKVKDKDGQTVEGYHVYVGGGCDQDRGLGRELVKSVPFTSLPTMLEGFLKVYLAQRRRGETFVNFTRRHEVAELRQLFGLSA